MQMKMKNIFWLIMFDSCLWAMSASANLYKVTGVPVVAERSSALEAKEAALAEGQVVAFKRLIKKLSPNSDSLLPNVSEEAVLSYVQGVSIENEKTTATKYIGSIAVEFNPAAVKEFLNSEKVTYLKAQPPSLLVIPVYDAGQGTRVLEDANPLYQALKEKGAFAPFYQAIVPAGDAEEQALISQNLADAVSLLPKYNKEKIMILRLARGDEDIWQINSDFYPKNNMENQMVYKKFRFTSGDEKMAAGQMADAVFREMEERWRGDRTSSLDDAKVLYLRVPVDGLADFQMLEKEMKEWTFFEELHLKGLYLPQILLEGTYKGSVEVLSGRLSDKGWKLELDETGSGATLTKVHRDE